MTKKSTGGFQLAGVDNVVSSFFSTNGSKKPVAEATEVETRLEEDTDLPVQQIPLDQIHRWSAQPRKYFDPAALQRLADEFRQSGFKGTVLVRPNSDGSGYLIVFGERRWRAAKQAGLTDILCVVEEMDDSKALHMAMGENLLREDLSKLEETEGLLAVLEVETGLERAQIIKLINGQARHMKSGTYVGTNPEAIEHFPTIDKVLRRYGIAFISFKTKNLQVLNLPDDVKAAHLEDKLDYSKALVIGKLSDEKDRLKILKQIKSKKLASLKDIQAAVKDLTQSEQQAAEAEKAPDIRTQFRQVTSKIGSAKTWKQIEGDSAKSKKLKRLLTQLEQLMTE